MAHPELINTSPYACELMFVTDEEAMPVCVPIVQATFDLRAEGGLVLRPKQPAVDLAGSWWGEPGRSSIKSEPQIAFMKPATDIVLRGHAYPANAERTQGHVGIRVGACQKVARVFGARRMTRRLGGFSISEPAPFERIALIHEHAFGGWDRRDPDKARHSFEARNPIGMGYVDLDQDGPVDVAMPYLEDPEQLYQHPSERPAPVGFGFCAPDWAPRVAWAGTYDKAWSDTRKPRWPQDFDRRFFNAASPGLISQGHLQGNEAVTAVGVTPSGARISFDLPGLPAPVCRVFVKGAAPVELQTVLDTLVLDTDQASVTLSWRACLPVRRGPHDVEAMELPPRPPQLFDED